MITEIRLNSNDAASTARFWAAIFNVSTENLGGGRYRITPAGGPAVVVATTAVWQTISRYADMTVVVDHGAADRLRENGFEVSVDGIQAVDVNGCDNTVQLIARGWDGISDVNWEEPDDAEKQRIEKLLDAEVTAEQVQAAVDRTAGKVVPGYRPKPPQGPGFRDLDVVELARDLPAEGLVAGDSGTIVYVYEGHNAYEVEFMDGTGATIAVVTVDAADLRAMRESGS